MTIEEIEAEWAKLYNCVKKQPWNLDRSGAALELLDVYFEKLLAVAKAAKRATEGKYFSGDMARPFLDLKIAVYELEKA